MSTFVFTRCFYTFVDKNITNRDLVYLFDIGRMLFDITRTHPNDEWLSAFFTISDEISLLEVRNKLLSKLNLITDMESSIELVPLSEKNKILLVNFEKYLSQTFAQDHRAYECYVLYRMCLLAKIHHTIYSFDKQLMSFTTKIKFFIQIKALQSINFTNMDVINFVLPILLQTHIDRFLTVLPECNCPDFLCHLYSALAYSNTPTEFIDRILYGIFLQKENRLNLSPKHVTQKMKESNYQIKINIFDELFIILKTLYMERNNLREKFFCNDTNIFYVDKFLLHMKEYNEYVNKINFTYDDFELFTDCKQIAKRKEFFEIVYRSTEDNRLYKKFSYNNFFSIFYNMVFCKIYEKNLTFDILMDYTKIRLRVQELDSSTLAKLEALKCLQRKKRIGNKRKIYDDDDKQIYDE